MSHMELTITNEEDAWKALEKAIQEEEQLYPVDFSFENWPTIDIKLTGPGFESSLTSQSMEGLVEFQKIINKTYAQMRYNGPSTKLKNDDKKDLEITYKVSEGSTEVKVDFTQAAVKMAEGLVNNMTGTEMVITILGSMFIGSCAYGFTKYINSQQQNKLADTLKTQSKEETKRTEILASAMSRAPRLYDVQEEAEETYNKVLRGIQESETLTIDGKTYDHEEIKAIIRTPRAKSAEAQLNGNYRVEKFDNTPADEYIVFVSDIKTHQGFSAKLKTKHFILIEPRKKLLSKAVMEKTPVYLKINAKIIRDQVISATIVDIEKERPDDKDQEKTEGQSQPITNKGDD